MQNLPWTAAFGKSLSIFAVHFRAYIISNQLQIDVVLPCYNPAVDWDHLVIARFRMLQESLPNDSFRLFIVNDGSTQGLSPKHLETLRSSIPEVCWLEYDQNRGKGYALRYGLKQTSAPVVIYTDIDLPYTVESMVSIAHALREGADLAIGTRDSAYYEEIPPSRRRISKILKGFNKLVFGLRVPDTQCGLKGMNARGREMFLQTTIDRYLFDLELVMQASRDKSVRLDPVVVHLEPGVELSSVRAGLLLQELGNLVRLFFKRWF